MSDDIDRANDLAAFDVHVALANRPQPTGKPSLEWCDDCGNEIPEARRAALPGVERCVDCAREHENKDKVYR